MERIGIVDNPQCVPQQNWLTDISNEAINLGIDRKIVDQEFYNLKLKRIKDDIIGLNVIESLLDTVGQLNHFGYDYFFNFEQRELWERTIPPASYELSPGDEIIISIWGQTERREKKIIGRVCFVSGKRVCKQLQEIPPSHNAIVKNVCSFENRYM